MLPHYITAHVESAIFLSLICFFQRIFIQNFLAEYEKKKTNLKIFCISVAFSLEVDT